MLIGLFLFCEDEKNSSNIINKSDKTKPFDSDPHSIIGLTLLIGFVIMLLVDQISAGTSSNAHYNQLSSGNYLLLLLFF